MVSVREPEDRGDAGSCKRSLWCDDMQVTTEEELVAALKEANGKQKDKVCFIQCKLDPEDCSPQLREWGARLANYNARPPKIN